VVSWESLVNNGMKLSPWSTEYLWTAVKVCVALASTWVARQPQHSPSMEMGKPLKHAVSWQRGDLFCVLGEGGSQYFANYPFGSSLKNVRIELEDDVTTMIHEQLEEIHLVALASHPRRYLCRQHGGEFDFVHLQCERDRRTYITPAAIGYGCFTARSTTGMIKECAKAAISVASPSDSKWAGSSSLN